IANPDPYYDNIDTAAIDSSKSESENRYNIKSQTTAKPRNKFNNKNRPTTYPSKSVGNNAKQTFNNILDKPNVETHYSSEEQYRIVHQKRIRAINCSNQSILWNAILKYISWGDAPLSLRTDPTESNIKNFKIKILANKLPTFLILHIRYQKNTPTTYVKDARKKKKTLYTY
ncbi:42470_t:CDS:2, partial [Gigaspora margarita]